LDLHAERIAGQRPALPLTPGQHTVSVGANYGAPEAGAYSQMRKTFEYVLHVGGRTQITFVTPMMVEASAP
ncbi:hypothetical protein TEP_07095, partial [Stenotrophomonas sp. TEPEL]